MRWWCHASGQSRVETLGGPTVVIDYGGLRLLTDPTFDPPGEYPVRSDYALVKTGTDGWRHFTEGAHVRSAFTQAGLSDRLIGCEPGLVIEV